MTIKVRYDVIEDRMLLVMQPPGNEATFFWVNRRQWLILLARLRAVAEKIGVALASPDLSKLPKKLSSVDLKAKGITPEKLDGIRVRVDGEKIYLLLVQGTKARRLDLKPSGIKQFEELVSMQGERAGWDLSSGLERLRAEALTKAEIRRISES